MSVFITSVKKTATAKTLKNKLINKSYRNN